MDRQTPSGLPDYLGDAQRRRLRWVYDQTRIEITSARWWRVRRGWVMSPRRLRDDFLFIPLTHGLHVRLDGRPATIRPGQCLLALTGQEHAARLLDDAEETQIVALHANLLPQWGGPLDQLFDNPFPTLPDLTASETRLARLVHLLEADPPVGRLLGEQLLRDWLAFWTLAVDHAAADHLRPDPRIAQAVAIIHDRYAQPLTVEQLAHEVNLRPVQFRKLFRQAYRTGPKAYLAEYRLNQAARLLRMGLASVKEIAYATGFSEEHYFHAAFRRHFHLTPTTYRRRSRQVV